MDKSLHKKRDGREFQMLDYFSQKPMEFSKAKHNYCKRDFDALQIGQCMCFQPMFGNQNPVYSVLKRIK